MIRLSVQDTSLPKIVDTCIEVLLSGGIICVPTDTVYGLICEPDFDSAVLRLFEIKKRPKDQPFALFTPSWPLLLKETNSPCPVAEQLAKRFWPGPLTLVVQTFRERLFTKKCTVGVRCPKGDVIQALLDRKKGLLVNTSFNRSGMPPLWSLDSAGDLLRDVDVVIDAGELPKQAPSTVVDCIQLPPQILRTGDITEKQIGKVVSEWGKIDSKNKRMIL